MPYKNFLSVKGNTKQIQTESNGEKFDWCGSLADAGIIAGLSFFTCIVGTNLADLALIQSLYAAGVAAGLQFFTIIALKRGIGEKKEVKN